MGLDGYAATISDGRGTFLEWFRQDAVAAAIGHPLNLLQANASVSGAGVIRGIHFADVPPSQAKYVTCVYGAVLDVVVDIRIGSPTFGSWASMPLNDADRRAVYVAEGLGTRSCRWLLGRLSSTYVRRLMQRIASTPSMPSTIVSASTGRWSGGTERG